MYQAGAGVGEQTGGAKLTMAVQRRAFMVEFLDKLGLYQVSA
jgi:hypothetical protein